MNRDDQSKNKMSEIDQLDSMSEDFVETFFKKGAEFTSKLISEMQALQREVEALRIENAELRHHLASEEALREMMQKIEALEAEKIRLTQNIRQEAQTVEDYQARYAEVEKELHVMANLYVALSQLHSTFEPKEMLGAIEQLLAQFVGAGSFVIYLRRGERAPFLLVPVHAYHYREELNPVEWNVGPVGESAATQIDTVFDPIRREDGAPLACIPLVFGKETVGVIAVMDFFEQKQKFEDIDFEFFRLLAVHSAPAIVAAGLMASENAVLSGLERYERL